MELKELLQQLNSGDLTFKLKGFNELASTNGKASTMSIELEGKAYDILKSYDTFVSIIEIGTTNIYARRYSATTSKHQKMFREDYGI